jgi:GntR family transcriptional repressor for pyruvate dehydrogenase complex
MRFEKVNRAQFKKKSSLIAEQILQMIKTGVYPPGSKLPPERIIAEQMEVGRPSVREAISALQIAGVLESRPGEGTYLTAHPISENPMRNALAVLEESDSPFEVLQTRKALEIGVVHLAINVATEDDIRNIKQAWASNYEQACKGNYEGFIRQGRDFHLAIASATKSRAIVGLTDGLLKMAHQPLWVYMREQYYRQDGNRIGPMVQLHADIVKAIEERDSQRAIQLVEEHFDIQLRQHYEDSGENPDPEKNV